MRGDLLGKWLVLVVCVCGVAVAGEPNEPVAEANEPWIAADHLTPWWQSMALTTRRFNSEKPEYTLMPAQRSLSLAGHIDVTDPNGLIGLSEVATNAAAFDEAGKPISTTQVSQWPPSYKALTYVAKEWVPTGERTISIMPYDFSIDMSMDFNTPFPSVLSRVEWSMSALLSDAFQVVDLAFVATDDWVKLTPGLDILVEQAVARGGKYEYTIKARYDPNQVWYPHAMNSGSRRSPSDQPDGQSYYLADGALPEIVVTDIDVLDMDGKSIWQQSEGLISTSRGVSSSGGLRIVTRTFSSRCPECGDAALIRYVLALKPYNKQAQLTLENVPVPIE